MEEHALIMPVLTNSSVLAHYSFLANAVKLIVVIFMNVKITETVSLLLSMVYPHQNANAREITAVLRVTLNCAQTVNVETELVLMESVSVMKTTSTMETFV